ncbi:MAG: DNA-directed RNA polymerase subunit beta' [Ardenticatenaceae bacterium]
MEIKDFSAIRISLASPEQINSWSYGEVTKPETINYRRLRPERDGLFCEAIFGPQKDWQCYCGKYKKVRFKGIVCDKCGVEVTRSAVRRERMGHIQLASPVAHIWYTRRVPSYLGLLLNISRRNLDRVLYFAQYIITNVDEKARENAVNRLQKDSNRDVSKRREVFDKQLSEMERLTNERIEDLRNQLKSMQKRLDRIRDERTQSLMKAAKKTEKEISKKMGRRATEDILFEPLRVTLVKRREIIRPEMVKHLKKIVKAELTRLEKRIKQQKSDRKELVDSQITQLRQEYKDKARDVNQQLSQIMAESEGTHSEEIDEINSLRVFQFLNEAQYRDLYAKYGHIFEAKMGAEALYEIVKNLDLNELEKELRDEIRKTRSKQRRKKATKRLKVVTAFLRSGNKPEWMVLTVLPVIPPDLRPMVQLDGGRFATSDLNDLYRRVINRNNRLKRLLELDAPDVIIRNEKRMLQEAVDSLIDNSRRGKAVSLRGKRKLKSLSDMLKGKQGRFRRNLLGKRVDYSGRSVIVVGPHLKMDECGLPKKMALELFKPFVINKLVGENFAPNVKGAKRIIEQMKPEVWGILEKVIEGRPVMLNRAPTLHRLGIQAFLPRLIDGSAIELHPLACSAFNADFDGDQMAMHVPLSERAVNEALNLMLATRNLLKPADGEPTVGPTKDMVLGCYYLTQHPKPNAKGTGRTFSDSDEAILAYELDQIKIHAAIKVRIERFFSNMMLAELKLSRRTMDLLIKARIITVSDLVNLINDKKLLSVLKMDPDRVQEVENALEENEIEPDRFPNNQVVETTVGRIIFNEVVPQEMGYQNGRYNKGALKGLVGDCYNLLDIQRTAVFADAMKDIGFEYATKSGITLAVDDITVPEKKWEILATVEKKVEQIERQYRRGLMTSEEQYRTTVQLWTDAKEEVTEAVKESLDPFGNLAVMSNSGSVKGGIQPLAQLAGMRGLMADPNGRIIPLPIRSNFREGLNPLEYFISTHGSRKGLADTALRTADAGYLTRRLVDVAQDVIVRDPDCGTLQGLVIDNEDHKLRGQRILGRFTISPVVDVDTGQIVVDSDTYIIERVVRKIDRANVSELLVRSPIYCQLRAGICVKCYGRDLGRGRLVNIGEAVGIIAAQSIGEPGTQLTLRTFHTGGVAGVDDITQGLPRITELFEARNPKGEAVLSKIAGRVEIERDPDAERRMVRIINARAKSDQLPLPEGHYELLIDDGDLVRRGDPLVRTKEMTLEAPHDGVVLVDELDNQIIVRYDEKEVEEYDILPTARLRVSDGEIIEAGHQLTEGAKNPHQVLEISGIEAVQEYLVEQVQYVYRSQGVSIHDKHIEIIVRSMMRRVRITASGETNFLLGDLVERLELEEVNRAIIEKGGLPAKAKPVLLGITKAALSTESFLSASSFQHTINVLALAAIEGKVDHLEALKENVIIGKLIPAGTGYRTIEEEDPETHIRPRQDGEDSFDDFDFEEDFGDFQDFGDDELDPDADDIDDLGFEEEEEEIEPPSYLNEKEEVQEEQEEEEEEGEIITDLELPDPDIEDEEFSEIELEEEEEEEEEEEDFDDFYV